jgi:hypothetical protein
VKLSLCFFLNGVPSHEDVLGSGGIAPVFLTSALDGGMVRITHRSLCFQVKSTWYPLNRRLGGPQSRSGRGDEEKNSQLPPEIEP